LADANVARTPLDCRGRISCRLRVVLSRRKAWIAGYGRIPTTGSVVTQPYAPGSGPSGSTDSSKVASLQKLTALPPRRQRPAGGSLVAPSFLVTHAAGCREDHPLASGSPPDRGDPHLHLHHVFASRGGVAPGDIRRRAGGLVGVGGIEAGRRGGTPPDP